MNKNWFWALGLSAIIAGCSEEKDYFLQGNDLKPESEYADFETTKDVAFSVNYGEYGYKALVEVFTSNPIAYDEEGNVSVVGEPIYKTYMDTKGCFNGNVQMPAGTKKVWLYSTSWGVPMCVEAAVENGRVAYKAEQSVAAAAKATRVNADAKIVKTIEDTEYNNFYSLVDWNWYGAINDVNGIVSYDEKISPEELRKIQTTLWEGKTSKPTDLDYRDWVKTTEVVNTRIFDMFKDTDGKYKECKSAKITLTFLTERASYLNVLGYYYYKTGTTPDVKEVKKYILIPNANTVEDARPVYTDNGKTVGAISMNTSFQLLYENEDGSFTENIPAGYTIGFFVLPDAFKPNNDIKIETINAKKPIFSNCDWNVEYAGKKERFMSLNSNYGVIYGIEDGADRSYEDILFMITADPQGAITDEERPTLPDPVNPEPTTQSNYFTYAFEDIWPDGGDYDLNDVIIDHKRDITFTDENTAIKVVDTFTPVQPEGSATFVDAFGIQLLYKGEMTVEGGNAVYEPEGNSHILYQCTKDEAGKTITITRTFAEGVDKPTIEFEETLNPFIVSKFTAPNAGNRTEIHLPHNYVTDLADASLQGTSDDAYFINKDGKHPFALKFMWDNADGRFIPVSETVEIGKEYPDYDKWVENGCGEQYADWYKNYAGPNK